jgi:hypothetical protein
LWRRLGSQISANEVDVWLAGRSKTTLVLLG